MAADSPETVRVLLVEDDEEQVRSAINSAALPPNALKIDRSFVATISEEDEGNDVIVRSTVALAHSLGLPVIAEGIECPDQLKHLRSLGCEFGQGYLFSPALSAADTRSLLESWVPSDIVALGAAA